MSTETLAPQSQTESLGALVQQRVTTMIDELIEELPDPDSLTPDQRRGIIARYSAVLEGNFIYWMTATYLAVDSEDAHPILLENLHEEVRDSHPVMLRKFAIAARAFPTDKDALFVNPELTQVRLFLGKLQGVQSLLTMAFFEGLIQRLMPFLWNLAALQGSMEREYTDVHGVCDIAHTEGLFRAVSLEMAANPVSPEVNLLEGVELLRTLMQRILEGPAA
jgi:hypothetical protein